MGLNRISKWEDMNTPRGENRAGKSTGIHFYIREYFLVGAPPSAY